MYKAVISSSLTDWTGTWYVVDENYKYISKHYGRDVAEREAERLNQEENAQEIA